jgi:hypothetical protein
MSSSPETPFCILNLTFEGLQRALGISKLVFVLSNPLAYTISKVV